jgi:murein DD-endopeptidase MepM/ murein hydrolase activator NlpD
MPPTAEPQIAAVALEPTLTDTLALTDTAVLTPTGVITLTPPTPIPTPVPRTVALPVNLPDYRAASDHFWFSRPFTTTFETWGSHYYPYGTNARGQYFWHFGIDIQNRYGTPIIAAEDGVVVHAGPDTTPETQLGPWPDFYGQAVMIEHPQQWQGKPVYTLYGHVSRVLVRPGQTVKVGQPIALVGQLGVAIGPHLHFEVRVGGKTYYDTRNPDLWLKPDPGYGVIAGRVVDYQNYLVPEQLVTLHYANDPARFWRQTYTYPDNQVNSDDTYMETFSFGDVPAGRYLLKTLFDGHQLSLPVTVTEGTISFGLLQQTQPPKVEPNPPPAPLAGAEPTTQPPPEGAQPQ